MGRIPVQQKRLATLGVMLGGCLALLTWYDETWTRYLQSHVLHGFTTFMGRTFFEGERVGGSDLATVFQIVSIIAYFAALRAPRQSLLYQWRPYLGFMVCVVLLANLAMVHSLKWSLGRARPIVVLESGLPYTHWFQFGSHYITQGGYRGSFPSGHTASVMTFLGAAFLPPMRGKEVAWGVLVTVYGVLMAVGRAMLGSHWISDGLLSVFLTGGLIYALYRWGVRLADQIAYGARHGVWPALPYAWEVRLCAHGVAGGLGLVLLVFGLRAPFFDQTWLTLLSLPGGTLLFYGMQQMRRTHGLLLTALEDPPAPTRRRD